MIKLISVTIFSLIILSGCGGLERTWTQITGSLTIKCSPHGIAVLQSDSGIAIARDKQGNVIKCEED